MRKFIVSDLHGSGEVYDSIMGYLERLALICDVELYINGDLIDWGLDSFRILADVYQRIKGKGNVKIKYLGGNHELMLYQELVQRLPGGNFDYSGDWINNGGFMLEGELDVRSDGEEWYSVFKDLLGNLNIYHKFEETVNGNNIVLVHAQPPQVVLDKCHLRIKDNNDDVFKAVWTREEIRESLLFGLGKVIGHNKLGKEGYLTIIGHTPVDDACGFKYNAEENYFDIDGGSSFYSRGFFEHDHVPLVEVLDGGIVLLTFNHNNEIICGHYFDGELKVMDSEMLYQKRLFIDHRLDNNGVSNKKLIKEIWNDIN